MPSRACDSDEQRRAGRRRRRAATRMNVLVQPWSLPSISARIRRSSPPVSVTSPIGSSRLCSGSLDSCSCARREHDRADADRDVHEEDPAPREPRGEHPAGERPDRDRRADRRAPDAERGAALAAVELLREERERGREHHRAADALDPARDDQEERVVRGAARGRGEREEDDRRAGRAASARRGRRARRRVSTQVASASA